MPGRELLRRLAPLLAGALALALYLSTLAPGLYWGDSAQLQLSAETLRLGVGGRDYPLWSLVAAGLHRLTGLSPALAANLAAALWGAGAVSLCYGFARRLTGSALAAGVAAGALAVSHLHWSSSSVAEVYSAVSCFLFLLLFTTDAALDGSRRAAFLFGLVAGLSLLHHRMIQICVVALLVPLVVRWLAARRLGPSLAAAVAGGILGAVPLLVLSIAIPSTGTVPERLMDCMLGAFRPSLPSGLGLGRGLLGLVAYEGRFLALNLAGPQLVLAVVGAAALRESPRPLAPLASLVAAGVLSPFLFPHLGDRYVLLLPAVCAACVLAALGASRARRGAARALLLATTALLPIGVYAGLAAGPTLDRIGFFRGAAEAHQRAFLWPGKRGNREAEEVTSQILERVPQGAVLLAGWGEGEPIRYRRVVHGLGRGVTLRIRHRPDDPARIRAARPGARIFLSSYPYLPFHVSVPPGQRLDRILPGTLWELVPADAPAPGGR